jgi:hypothetical protein
LDSSVWNCDVPTNVIDIVRERLVVVAELRAPIEDTRLDTEKRRMLRRSCGTDIVERKFEVAQHRHGIHLWLLTLTRLRLRPRRCACPLLVLRVAEVSGSGRSRQGTSPWS